jgi:hypothetical protein
MKRLLFVLGYVWALPTTLIGLVLAAGGLCLPVGFNGGVLWFKVTPWSPWMCWKRKGFSAITIGGVGILAYADDMHDGYLMAHELRHFWQARVLGAFFLPAYGLASLWAMARGRHVYFDNALELDAQRHEDDDTKVA